jgi:hypothetical protein
MVSCLIKHGDFTIFTAPTGLSTACIPTLGPTKPSIQWVPGTLSPGVKRPRREADQSPSSSAEVKNCGTILPLPHCIELIELSAGTTLLPPLVLTGRHSYTCPVGLLDVDMTRPSRFDLKMEAACTSEMSATLPKCTRCKNPRAE